MKKCLSAVVAVCLVVLLAVPAMALDTRFSGQYRVRGFHNTNQSLSDFDASASWMDMRFRLRTDFIVSDHLTVSTRFDALDNKRFGNADLSSRDGDNIDWDRAWMTINTDYGIFMAGRMQGGTWGTLFNDTDSERDRLRWHNSFGDLTLYAIYEKNAELDGNVQPATGIGREGNEVSDQDNDIYYLGAAYKMENISTGLLYGYVNNKGNPAFSEQYHLFIPYVIGQFGPFGFSGELRYNGFGERDFDIGQDRDIEQLSFNVEGTFSMDMFQFELGGVYVRGDSSPVTGSKIRGYSGGIGDDWQKVWILTNSEDDGIYRNLGGGLGNLSTSGGLLDPYGVQLYYAGVTMAPMENLDVKLLAAYARADKTPSGVDKSMGMEYDLFLNYRIFDNLTYSFIAAYLDAGAFWRDANPLLNRTDLKDNFHLFHQLSLAF
jgi:hypothetical protein